MSDNPTHDDAEWDAIHHKVHDPSVAWLQKHLMVDGFGGGIDRRVSVGAGCIALDIFLNMTDAVEITDENQDAYDMFAALVRVGAAFQRSIDRGEVSFNGKVKFDA